jgi:tetratricopeptide (TPR) repeat protein
MVKLSPRTRRVLAPAVCMLAGLILSAATHAELPANLQEKQKKFSEAYQLIKKKDFAPALGILQANIAAYPDAPNIDYEYVWALVCLAELERYEEMPAYYQLVRSRYQGMVHDPITDLRRDWTARLTGIGAKLRAVENNERAAKALDALVEIDRLEPVSQTGSVRPFASRMPKIPKILEYPLVGMGSPEGNFTIVVSRDQFLSTPTWKSPAEPLPVSFREAISRAEEYAAEKGFAKARANSATLTRLDDLPGCWYFHVSLQGNARETLKFPLSSLVVLMDGAVVEARHGTHLVKYEGE